MSKVLIIAGTTDAKTVIERLLEKNMTRVDGISNQEILKGKVFKWKIV